MVLAQSHPRSSDASDPGAFLTGLPWDLVVLSVSVVALAAARTVSRVVEHNRSSGD